MSWSVVFGMFLFALILLGSIAFGYFLGVTRDRNRDEE